MHTLNESKKFLASDAGDKEEYERKARYLQTVIESAIGQDISSLPAAIQSRVDVLARTAATLGLDDTSTSTYTSAMSKLSSERLQIQLLLIQLQKAENELREANAIARHREALAASWLKYADLEADTVSLEHRRRAMAAKARDYQKQLSTIPSKRPSGTDESVTITSLMALQESLRQKEREIKALKARLSVFQGLPPNLDLAKQELKIARERQIQLMTIREKLLGRMTVGLD